MTAKPHRDVRRLLATAITALAGTERPGQVAMADAVADAMARGEHLLVQAGTGTGKSLAYLVPALLHACQTQEPVVVATATLALQAQLVGRDLPDLTGAVGSELDHAPTFAVLKGRSNYACLHRVRVGAPDDQGVLVDVPPAGPLGRQVVELRDWAEEQSKSGGDGDRDEAPSHQNEAWSHVSVSARECLGATQCPFGTECFAERARARAMATDIVVTNHALLAIDALDAEIQVLPEHDVVVIDEAHQLVDRVTSVASDELTEGMVARAARRARSYVPDEVATAFDEAATALARALGEVPPGRVEQLTGALGDAVSLVRQAAQAVWSAVPNEAPPPDDLMDSPGDPNRKAAVRAVRITVEHIRDVAARVAALSTEDVVWVAEGERGRTPALQVAPLEVADLLRDRLFATRTCILTSATLQLGGGFDPIARSVGLPATADGWRGLDVGSPFDYGRQAIRYVARRLPRPARDGIQPPVLDELCSLVEAAGGRTLGLFSSQRAAVAAAAHVRERVDVPLLCQGEGQLAKLQRQFIDEPATCLFGTLSLWQGLDVPGDTCRLVVIDRIPFPRPDDPLMSARARAADHAGHDGFIQVSAAQAALLLAQGVGRLIRRTTDRGVVAILDPRLVAARYGNFLRASLPPMWATTDRDVVLGALRRLAASPE